MAKRGPKPKYTDAEVLQQKIDEYFDENKVTPTVSGLAYHLGFTSRKPLSEGYIEGKEDNEEIGNTLRRAKLRIAIHYEEALQTKYAQGPIFMLKNLGMKDTSELEMTGAGGGPLVIRTNAMMDEEGEE